MFETGPFHHFGIEALEKIVQLLPAAENTSDQRWLSTVHVSVSMCLYMSIRYVCAECQLEEYGPIQSGLHGHGT